MTASPPAGDMPWQAGDDGVDLNDSDETHFSPDLDKSSSKDRRLSLDDEDGRYFADIHDLPGREDYLADADLGDVEGAFFREADDGDRDSLPIDLDATFFCRAEAIRSVDHLQQDPAQPDSDETFFDPPAAAVRNPTHDRSAPLPDSDETFFEPAAAAQAGPQDRLDSPQPDSDETFFEPAAEARAGPQDRRDPPQPDSDETVFECVALGLSGGEAGRPAEQQRDCGYLADTASFFTQDLLEWSQMAMGADLCPEAKDHDGEGDLYFQLQDPLTQEVRLFKLPGRGAGQDPDEGPDTMRLLTQDLGWTQPMLPNSPPIEAASEDQLVPLQALAPDHQDGDDAFLPPWGSSQNQQIKIDDIVASLNNMSFCMDVRDADDILSEFRHPTPLRCEEFGPFPGSPHRAPTSSTLVQDLEEQRPASPTFNNCRGRGRGRPRRASAKTDKARAPVQVSGSPVLGVGVQRVASGKRKRHNAPQRSSQAAHSQTQSQLHSQLHSSAQGSQPSSPYSPPRSKMQKFSKPLTPNDTPRMARAKLNTTYSRLQDLRFHMQDILAGRESLPSIAESGKLHQEVSEIITSLNRVAQMDTNCSGKARLKREQAKQAAEKLLHQLKVLMEDQESSAPSDEAVLSNPLQNQCVDLSQNCCNLTKSKDPPKFSENETERRIYLSPSPKCSRSLKESTVGRGSKRKVRVCTKKENFASIKQKKTKKKLPCASETQSLEGGIPCASETQSLEDGIAQVSLLDKVEEIQGNLSEPKTSESPDSPIAYTPDINDEHFKTIQKPRLEQGECQTKNYETPLETVLEEEDVLPVVDQEKQQEYETLVQLIKTNTAAPLKVQQERKRRESFIWKGGPLNLTGILPTNKAELEPCDDYPPNFWEDPQAAIPDEWIKSMEWDESEG